MDHVFHDSVRLEPGVEYFLFVGEIKAAGLNDFVQQGLERRFGRKFRPITVCPDVLLEYPPGNILAINPNVAQASAQGAPLQCIRMHMGHFAAHVSEDARVQALLKALLARQDQVFVWQFESRLELSIVDGEKVVLIGPNPELVHKFNDKTWQYEKFSELTSMADYRICSGRDAMLEAVAEMEQTCPHGMFVSCDYSAGGAASLVTSSAAEAAECFADPGGRYLISEYVPHVWDPTVLAVVGNKDQVYVAGVADMYIEDGNKFRGSTYPSSLPATIQERLRESTAAVGRELGRMGFQGIFGCDFIVDAQGRINFIEVNPRKQGTTMEFCCSLQHLLPEGAANLPELEMSAILDGKFPWNVAQPDHSRAADIGLYWGTYNHKVDCPGVFTRGTMPVMLPERSLFSQVASGKGQGGYVLLEYVGTGVEVMPGTFIGRVAAVDSTRDGMHASLEYGRLLLRQLYGEAE